MFDSITQLSKGMMIATLALFSMLLATARDAGAANLVNCRQGAMAKNLMSYSARLCASQASQTGELTRKAVRNLTMAAKTPEDHLKLARYYAMEADQLDSQGAGYEEAAAIYRHGPVVKNLGAPGTAARYESSAKGYRDEAKANRALAASHEQMAKSVLASL
jgi:hypothetical protein